MNIPVAHLLPFIVAAGVLTWWRPRVALFLPLVFHMSYLLRSQVGLGALQLPITLLEVLLWIAVVSAIVGYAWVDARVRGAYQDAWRALPCRALLCIIVFVAAATVSAAIAPHPRTAWGQWRSFIIEPIVYAAVLIPTFRSPSGQRRVAAALLLGGVVSAVLSLTAAAHCPLPTAYCPVTEDFGRLRGIYDVPNSLALILAPLTVFAAVIVAVPRQSGGWLVHLARWSLLLFVPTLLLTQSFGGLLAAAGATLITRFRTIPIQRRKVVLLGLLGVLLLGLGLQGVTGKLAHALAPNSPVHARLQIWSVALALIRDHPILGTGLGTFEPAYQQKLHELLVNGSRQQDSLLPPLEWLVRDPHNILLSFWLNTGLLGLLSMGGLIVVTFRRALLSTPDSLYLAAGAALLCLLLFGLVDVPYFKNDLSLLWWVFLGSAVVVVPPARKNHRV